MQYICLSICTLLDVDEKEITEITKTISGTAFKFTTMNFEYRDVVKVLKDGPYTRGRERKQFQVKDGHVDLYTLIIQAIAPPFMEVTLDALKQRIDSFITDGPRLDKKEIREGSQVVSCIYAGFYAKGIENPFVREVASAISITTF